MRTEGRIYEFAATAPTDAERFVALSLDDIALLVAQREIHALEPVLDVASHAQPATTKHAYAAGVLELAGGTCPVYALDGELRPLPKIPQQHRICAIMNYRDAPYSLTCREVRLLSRTALSMHDIPRPLLRQNTSPVKSLGVADGRLLLVTTAAALFAHVSHNVEAEIISFDDHARKSRI